MPKGSYFADLKSKAQMRPWILTLVILHNYKTVYVSVSPRRTDRVGIPIDRQGPYPHALGDYYLLTSRSTCLAFKDVVDVSFYSLPCPDLILEGIKRRRWPCKTT